MERKKSLDHGRLLVLSLLSAEDMYGYQIIEELSRRSEHLFEMKEGTLYPVLHALERDGLVEAYMGESLRGKPRKYYHLTRRGREALKTETQEWTQYSAAVNAVLQSVPAGGLA